MHFINHLIHFSAYFLILLSKALGVPSAGDISGYAMLAFMGLIGISHAGFVWFIKSRRDGTEPEASGPSSSLAQAPPLKNIPQDLPEGWSELEFIREREIFRIKTSAK